MTVRYQFVQDNKNEYAVAMLCRVLGVSKSGYYAWQTRPQSAREQANQALLEQTRRIVKQSRDTYGSPRVHRELREAGVCCGENRVARLMRKHGICPVPVPKFVVTTDSNHAHKVADNVLDRQFAPELATGVNRRWAGDITYLWTREGWLYLSVVLDLFSRRVVGWSMDVQLHKELPLQALEAALQARHPEPGLLHHSDRGSQYASAAYQEKLRHAEMVGSMSRKGNCWDNAVVESFFGTLKRELVKGRVFTSREQARQEVFEYIEVWYNRKRRHSTLGYLSPEQFERQQASMA